MLRAAAAALLRPAAPALLRRLSDDRAEVILDEPEQGVAPGQACVFYQGERVLGGGWIMPSREA